MSETTREPGICEMARRHGLPLLALGWVDLPFLEDDGGGLHPSSAGLVCGSTATRLTRTTFGAAEPRICAACLRAATDPAHGLVPDASPEFAQALCWVQLSNDLSDLTSLVTLARLSAFVRDQRAAAVSDELTWLTLGGRLLRELVRSEDEYFHLTLRHRESVASLRAAAWEALETWRDATAGDAATVLVLIEDADLLNETDLTAAIVARRATLPLEELSALVLAVSEDEREILAAEFRGQMVANWTDGEEPTLTPRALTVLEGVPLEHAAVLGELRRAGVGEGDPRALVRVVEALSV